VTDWPEDELELGDRRWPLAPSHLLPRERWPWWEQPWSDVLALGERYRIRPAKDWWDDGVQVEALAALAAWVERYDSGERDDPARQALAALRPRTRARTDPRRRAVSPRPATGQRSPAF
jgi:hypothetical protein